MIDIISPMIKKFLPFAKERMGFENPPRLFLKGDSTNADNPLGKTAFYNPGEKAITVYITGRHPKDVMRSLSHELVHHAQNCRGDFQNVGEMGEGYAQNDDHLREMEREAYEVGNLCFRDWEDSIKSTIYFEHLQKGDKKMSIKDWKNNEVKSLLSEAWGFSMNLDKLNENDEKDKEADLNEDEAFAPNHYCVHHGGVNHNGKVEMAEAVNHNYNEKLGKVTHYDMKLADGTILEGVAAEDIEVTNASLAEEHGHPMKRDDDEEELDEQSRTDRPDRARPEGGRRLDEEDEDELEEGEKKPDADGDGVPDWADKKPGKNDKEKLKEALKKILRKHL
jgi:hypothetical protein